jgi:ketosteroid isomerase-like protein
MRFGLNALVLCGLLVACNGGGPEATTGESEAEQFQQLELLKLELMQEDWDFNERVNQGGPSSWSTFFAPNGFELRAGLGVIEGREAIHESFMEGIQSGEISGLRWTADRAEISESGDLGYTMGTYQRSTTDSAGVRTRIWGGYLRIWRRQPDGGWKVEVTSETPVTDPEVIEMPGGGGN